jgi:hypothetical protein
MEVTFFERDTLVRFNPKKPIQIQVLVAFPNGPCQRSLHPLSSIPFDADLLGELTRSDAAATTQEVVG